MENVTIFVPNGKNLKDIELTAFESDCRAHMETCDRDSVAMIFLEEAIAHVQAENKGSRRRMKDNLFSDTSPDGRLVHIPLRPVIHSSALTLEEYNAYMNAANALTSSQYSATASVRIQRHSPFWFALMAESEDVRLERTCKVRKLKALPVERSTKTNLVRLANDLMEADSQQSVHGGGRVWHSRNECIISTVSCW